MENKGYGLELPADYHTGGNYATNYGPSGYVGPTTPPVPVVVVRSGGGPVAGSGGYVVTTTSQQPSSIQEAAWNFGTSFSDKNIRRLFVRKVYLILFAQMVVTFAFVAVFIFEPHVKKFVRRSPYVYVAAYAIFLVTYFTLICCPSVRRKHPGNLICLSIFTLSLSYLTATISSFHDTHMVLYAVGICTGVTLAVSLLAMWSKFDITGWGGMLWILSLTLFFFGIFAIFTYSQILYTIYSTLAALFLMMLLAYHTQLILGGRRYQLSEEEYVVAAMVLYLDIVYLFLMIIGIVRK